MCFTWCSLLNRKFSWFNWICIYFYLLLLAHSDLVSSFQSSVLHSQPKSTVGTPAYIAPEVLLKKEYDGKVMLWLSHFLPQVTRCCIYASICRSILWCVSRLRFFFLFFGSIDGAFQIADVWSCGVTLYVMLVGAYPFEDPEDPKNFRKTIQVNSHTSSESIVWVKYIFSFLAKTFDCLLQRILNVQYSIPDYVLISPECRHLISRIFVADPTKVRL